ncbi:hypothetical protein VC83_02397 [Pseudogymnoascus destructans]|uniref:Uncharacterized protein n=2 Tax=Pseudogymnoascus destructans TaxID=655981 RepID=L8G5C4_PSED2|nr:uncharacterized protein VC83_02397 [Pseudogymnoascus destructans]ELR07141.1 hypothetical protein GMDG_02410 [Pseudogymnoascus destructans 20631-21]OAF61112.1 hypothetical protein VC83_02397 [Pseudogymnoascus destructans]
MADEPLLPSLPKGLAPSFYSNTGRPGKRARLSSAPASSDPPLFSSDDDPSAENYSDPKRRQKMRYKGPWYKQEPDNSLSNQGERKVKRTLERQFDSGVWLGSDSTDDDADYDFLKGAPVTSFLANGLPMAMRPSPLRSRVIIPSAQYPSQEDQARQHIQQCLEEGNEDVDLSGKGLTSLSNSAIRPLASFSSIPVLTQGSYQTLLPKLRIFLARNELKRLPGEIFNLENLSVLSVRSNELTELPTSINRLRRLTELNASNNALRSLPFELLELLSCPSKIKILHLHPNPFYEPSASDDITETGLPVEGASDERTWGSKTCDNPEHDHARHSEWRRRFKCRSQVKFFDLHGSPVKGPEASTARPTSNTPSLLELCVKTWADTPNMPNLDEYLSGDYPEKLQHLLDNARNLRETEVPGRKCTICDRRFVIPRTEWIEWWEIEQSPAGKVTSEETVRPRDVIESQLPFMRRGCSWQCVPGKTPDEGPNVVKD